MGAQRDWYLGVVVRVDVVDPVLALLRASSVTDVLVQTAQTAHLTLAYAPPRPRDAAMALAETCEPIAAVHEPFTLTLEGAGSFRSAERIVHWLGVTAGREHLHRIRRSLAKATEDVLPHAFVPHCTLCYAVPGGHEAVVGGQINALASHLRLDAMVDSLWVAGFPVGDRPGHLDYLIEIPLGA